MKRYQVSLHTNYNDEVHTSIEEVASHVWTAISIGKFELKYLCTQITMMGYIILYYAILRSASLAALSFTLLVFSS